MTYQVISLIIEGIVKMANFLGQASFKFGVKIQEK
jgi:hypothetical protein